MLLTQIRPTGSLRSLISSLDFGDMPVPGDTDTDFFWASEKVVLFERYGGKGHCHGLRALALCQC